MSFKIGREIPRRKAAFSRTFSVKPPPPWTWGYSRLRLQSLFSILFAMYASWTIDTLTHCRALVAAFATSRSRIRPPTYPPRLHNFLSESSRHWRLFSTTGEPLEIITTSSETSLADCGYEKIFDLNLPEGRCVGLRVGNLWMSIDDTSSSSSSLSEDDATVSNATKHTTTKMFAPWVYDSLHPDEVAYASQLTSDASQQSFVGGRLALRQAMNSQIHDCILLKDPHGRPKLPPSFLGSVSHKGNVAVALVAPSSRSDQEQICDWAIGVDLEVRQKGKEAIARRILTEHERRSLGLLPEVDKDEEVLLRFSLKESLYKAMHPLICQYVTFQEAEVQPLVHGKVHVRLNLTSGNHEKFESVEAHWLALEDYFLTSAVVRLRPGVKSMSDKMNPEECKM